MVRVQGALLAQESGFSTACRRAQSGEGGYTGQKGLQGAWQAGRGRVEEGFLSLWPLLWAISPPSQWHVLIPQFLH